MMLEPKVGNLIGLYGGSGESMRKSVTLENVPSGEYLLTGGRVLGGWTRPPGPLPSTCKVARSPSRR